MNDNMNNNGVNPNNYNNPNVVPSTINNQQVQPQPMVQNPVQQPMYQQPIQPTNKKKDNIIIIVLGLIVVGLIIAILFFLLTGKADNKEKDSSNNNDNVVVEDDNNGSSEKEEDNKTENNNSSTSNNLPSDWTSMEFIFDGVKYSLTTPYTSFKNNGWEIHLDENRYPNGYAVKPNTRVLSTVEITNPKYIDTYITIGFLNNTTVEKDITECLVWSINISNDYVDTPVSFELPGGVKYGSSAAEIEAAYGKLDANNMYRSESLKYTVYHYSYDYNKYLDLTVYDDGGLKEISYRIYG